MGLEKLPGKINSTLCFLLTPARHVKPINVCDAVSWVIIPQLAQILLDYFIGNLIFTLHLPALIMLLCLELPDTNCR